MKPPLLLARAAGRLVGFAAGHVIETMRPLPCEPLPDVPGYVRGVSIIRGQATPVVDLARLLGHDAGGPPARWVTLHTGGDRAVAVGVDAVLGLRQAPAHEALPPLLQDVAETLIAELGRLDGELLTVLRAAQLLPEELTAMLSEARP